MLMLFLLDEDDVSVALVCLGVALDLDDFGQGPAQGVCGLCTATSAAVLRLDYLHWCLLWWLSLLLFSRLLFSVLLHLLTSLLFLSLLFPLLHASLSFVFCLFLFSRSPRLRRRFDSHTVHFFSCAVLRHFFAAPLLHHVEAALLLRLAIRNSQRLFSFFMGNCNFTFALRTMSMSVLCATLQARRRWRWQWRVTVIKPTLSAQHSTAKTQW